MYIPKAFGHQAEFFATIDDVARVFPPNVIRVTPTLGTDWNGESAVFFQVILADNAVPRPQLLSFTREIRHALVQKVRPLEDWGVLPYFDFLTQSEESRLKEPTWA